MRLLETFQYGPIKPPPTTLKLFECSGADIAWLPVSVRMIYTTGSATTVGTYVQLEYLDSMGNVVAQIDAGTSMNFGAAAPLRNIWTWAFPGTPTNGSYDQNLGANTQFFAVSAPLIPLTDGWSIQLAIHEPDASDEITLVTGALLDVSGFLGGLSRAVPGMSGQGADAWLLHSE